MSAAKSKKSTRSSDDLLGLALETVAETGWAGFSFNELANRADLALVEIRKHFRSKAAILDALSLFLDEAMLVVDPGELADLPPRDRVFELMMSRLEAMTPFRAGLVRLSKEGRRDPELALVIGCRLDRSMAWLQDAAGFRSSGLRSKLQRLLLTGVYLKTLGIWTVDDSGDLAKTMANLDKDLRYIENFADLRDGKR